MCNHSVANQEKLVLVKILIRDNLGGKGSCKLLILLEMIHKFLIIFDLRFTLPWFGLVAGKGMKSVTQCQSKADRLKLVAHWAAPDS
jgi:hypothetical protein